MRTPRGVIVAALISLPLAAVLTGVFRENACPPPPSSPKANNRSSSLNEPSSMEDARASGTTPQRVELHTSKPSEFHAEPTQNDSAEIEQIRSTLERTIHRELPAIALSENELDELASATFRLRNSQSALRNIPKTVDTIEERAEQRRHLAMAIDDFTYILEMSPDEFTRRVSSETTPGNRVDVWDPNMDRGELGDVLLRPIRLGEVE